MNYRREIDGLRAIAVVPVVFFHAGFQAFAGGFIGVDVFFVISGYLITSIILGERETGSFSLRAFYERRARRILPALFFVMFVSLPFAWLWLFPEDMKRFAQSLVAVPLFASNILFWRTNGYFETAAELRPLLHTWSLAVEEQYYVLFPILTLLIWPLGKRAIAIFFSLTALCSLAVAQWGAMYKPQAAFFLLPTRTWELLIGSLVALFLFSKERARNGAAKHHPWMMEFASAIGLLLIAYAACYFDETIPFPSVYTLVPTIGAALIILFATETTFSGRILGSKPLVGVGLISYSAYLWHQPLFAFAKHRSLIEPSSTVLFWLAVASFIFAYFSWRYVETPFRHSQRFTRKQIFGFGISCSIFFIAFGAIGYFSDGYAGRFNHARATLEKLENIDGGGEQYCAVKASVGGCLVGDKATPPTIAVLGDSHSSTLQKELGKKLAEENKSALFYFGNWCVPLIGMKTNDARKNAECPELMVRAYDEIARNKAIETVVLDAEWGNYTKGYRWSVPGASYYNDAFSKERSLAENARVFERSLQRTMQLLQSHGKKIIFVKSVPEYEAVLPSYLAKNFYINNSLSIDNRFVDAEKYLARNSEIDEALRKVDISRYAAVVQTFEIFCTSDHCQYSDPAGNLYYVDDSHLSNAGARLLVDKIMAQIK